MEAAASAEYGYYGGGAGPHETKTAGCGDHFVVDDLLALPPYDDEEEGATGETPLCLQPVKEEEGGLGNFSADSSIVVTAIDSCSNSFSRLADDDFPGEFYEPYDQLVELEWLSNYMGEGEETFAAEDLEKLKLISGGFSPAAVNVSAPAPVGVASAASATQSASMAISPSESGISAQQAFRAKKPPPSKKKDAAAPAPAPAEGRRCVHCDTDKTPQWRTGPMGPKTLCNACGVRYKSGRLVPEYRPAASPTFVMSKHSNSHRKVLELRRQKEVVVQQPPHVMGGAGGPAGGLMRMQSAMLLDGPVAAVSSSSPIVGGDEFLIHQHLGTADYRQRI
ncbi:GATA transcription factor 12 isoform X1 [Zea mays]|uniref:GATA-type domain-containing protein n=1 Tax=Zea mays TaxID=4577 RepID=A0A804UI69_MAIZE|nr:uncharacterized protein LOC100304362 isoform X1 [Zea mays]|eukprot:XP_023156554.1 uncharacterized protein LOC100304362 isoform X1 [Zea mays]